MKTRKVMEANPKVLIAINR